MYGTDTSCASAACPVSKPPRDTSFREFPLVRALSRALMAATHNALRWSDRRRSICCSIVLLTCGRQEPGTPVDNRPCQTYRALGVVQGIRVRRKRNSPKLCRILRQFPPKTFPCEPPSSPEEVEANHMDLSSFAKCPTVSCIAVN